MCVCREREGSLGGVAGACWRRTRRSSCRLRFARLLSIRACASVYVRACACQAALSCMCIHACACTGVCAHGMHARWCRMRVRMSVLMRVHAFVLGSRRSSHLLACRLLSSYIMQQTCITSTVTAGSMQQLANMHPFSQS